MLLNSVAATAPAIGLLSCPTRANKIRDRLKALNVNEASFNIQVDRSFYAKHPELNKRQLRAGPEDTALRDEWYNTAENLLDRLER